MMIHMMRSNRGPYRVLRAMFLAADAAIDFVVEAMTDRETPEMRRQIVYLQEKGYLKKLTADSFQLTDLAKLNLLKEIVAKRKSDGLKRIVVFDVPEDLRKNRDALRRGLREMGFRMAQRSVWVCDKPCEDLVRLLMKYYGMEKFVWLVRGELLSLKSTIVDFSDNKHKRGKRR